MLTLTTDGRRRLLLRALQAWDLGIFGVALAAYWVLFRHGAGPISRLLQTWTPFLWLAASAVLWHLCLAKADLYRSRRLSAGAGELWDIVKGTTLGTAFMATLGLALGLPFITPRMVQGVWVIATLLTMGWRVTLRVVLAVVRRSGRNLRLVLLIGSGRRARHLLQKLAARPELGFLVIGYVDDAQADATLSAPSGHGLPHLGALKDLPMVLAQNVIDEVFVILPMKSQYDRIATVVHLCEVQGIPVLLPVDLFDLEVASPRVDVLQGTPFLALQTNGVHGWYAVTKRGIDLLVSSLLLLALAPLFLVAAVLIRRDSPGPVFFIQERVGLAKRRFNLIKFRTMVTDGESMLPEVQHLNEVAGPVFKMRNDPRVTRIGRFLRRTSIDELPQLINVLKGDMSLVGPRPLPIRDVKGFTEDWQRRRFSVKPGMTCLWQVSGRSGIAFERWMELDMAYIDRSSLGLDLRILLRTIPAVLRGTGAH